LSAVYRNTAAALAVIAALALVTFWLAGAAWAWAAVAAGLAWLLAYHVRHLARLARWTADPRPGEVPEGTGSWDVVLTALHRYEREAARRQEELGGALTQLRRAAQAMPDGVVLLDARHSIEWCNDNAASMLGLDPRADIGRPIANLIREPEFIDYLAAQDEGSEPVRISVERGGVLSVQLIA